MDDTILAALEHENLIAAGLAIAEGVPGSVIRREGGVLTLSSGLPVRFFNQLLVTSPEAGATAIEAGVALLRERGVAYLVLLRRGADDRFASVLTGLGLAVPADAGPLPGMALSPLPASGGDAPVPANHEIRTVTDLGGLVDHRRTASAGFGLPEDVADMVMHEDLLSRPDCTMYVGYTDGMPVTTGVGIRTGRTIGVYNIATAEASRRQGLGAAMTARVAADGRVAGCDVAVLQASDMGRPIYERLGYRTVVEYDGYIDPAI
jgi:GNAT superfamily N-acetyltransferase